MAAAEEGVALLDPVRVRINRPASIHRRAEDAAVSKPSNGEPGRILMQHTRLRTTSLKRHPQLNEMWVQNVIADDPTILGLGEIILKDKERRQPAGGRLDLLFQEVEGATRYEVELQLGATDETHIIRTIEYWDVERRRYPQYDHVAVLVAENVTARFLNVIALFNGFIPIIVLQLSAIETADGVGLHFTKVVDALRLGPVDDDENVAESTDRAYWEARATPRSVAIADRVLILCKEFDSSLELKYNKHYIGFARNGVAFNFASCHPRKSAMNLSLKLPRSDEVDEKLSNSRLELLEYARWGAYRVKLDSQTIEEQKALVKELLQMAYEERS